MNKRVLGIKDMLHHKLVPGRAILVSTPWYQQKRINILNVYAPNDPNKNTLMWEKIHNAILNLPQPDIIMGDFNFIEDPLDRLPAHHDNPNTIDTWQALKSHLSLTDGRCASSPKSLGYTFAQSARQGGHQSRLDRIYVHEDMLPVTDQPIPSSKILLLV